MGMTKMQMAFNCLKVESSALREAIARASRGNKEARKLVDSYLKNKGQQRDNALRRMVEKYG